MDLFEDIAARYYKHKNLQPFNDIELIHLISDIRKLQETTERDLTDQLLELQDDLMEAEAGAQGCFIDPLTGAKECS